MPSAGQHDPEPAFWRPGYRRRATRRAVRRATLRDPIISILPLSSSPSGTLLRLGSCLQGVEHLGLLRRDEPDLDQVQRADEPVADAKAPGPGDRLAQRHG